MGLMQSPVQAPTQPPTQAGTQPPMQGGMQAPAQGGAQPAANDNGELLAAKKLTLRVMNQLYASPEMATNAAKMVAQGQDPAEGLAKATMSVMNAVRHKAGGQGENVIDMATPAVALYIAELAVHKGIIPDDKKILAGAIQIIIEQRDQGEQQPTQEPPPEQAAEAAPPAAASPGAPPGLLNSPVV